MLQGRLEKSGREHRRILAALRTGDPEQAENAMRAHLDSVVRDFASAGEAAAATARPASPAPGNGQAREHAPAGSNGAALRASPVVSDSPHNGEKA